MGFASEWLQSGPVFPALIKEAPDKTTGIIVVVPSFDEPEVTTLLDSLALCRKPECKVEVIIVVNSPSDASLASLKNNRETIAKAKEWDQVSDPFFRLYLLDIEKPDIKGWGVGLARKTGMDEALRRFNDTGNEAGVIACMDADCTVKENYFRAIEDELLERSDRKACSIYFEHPIAGKDHDPSIINAVIQYEIHLRYYLQALKYTGFPNAFHTVGSTLAVKALPYMKAGGMNRRQAGEDFYFVQKLLPSGGYFSLTSTTVFPSPRISGRVPFGTGAAIGKMIGSGEKVLLTYNPGAFRDLRSFFMLSEEFHMVQETETETLYNKFPASVRSFITFEEWEKKMNEIRRNTSGLLSFNKRFFEWFNMFRVVKYLNFAHSEIYGKIPVYNASVELPQLHGYAGSDGDIFNLLLFLRSLEKE
jgi:hypothetical protein